MRIKTSELTGGNLNYAVAICEGHKPYFAYADVIAYNVMDSDLPTTVYVYYDSDWSIAGPIIERERINVTPYGVDTDWYAHMVLGNKEGCADGPTLLIAAMRAYVRVKLGNEVEITEEP